MSTTIEDMVEKLTEVWVKSYPDHIVKVTPTELIWKDGTIMPLNKMEKGIYKNSDEVNLQQKLDDPTLLDQISIPYQKGPSYLVGRHLESGRARHISLFKKMYGGTKEAVERNLVEIPWLPKTFGERYKIRVTKVNGVSEKLRKISEELDLLPPQFKVYLKNPGGTYCWRFIVGTFRLSAHSFGMTLDIDPGPEPDSKPEYFVYRYWLWQYNEDAFKPAKGEKEIDYNDFPVYRNDIPWEIVEIFEKYGFIWLGKCFHYDTMHFEYRPELFSTHYFAPKIKGSCIHQTVLPLAEMLERKKQKVVIERCIVNERQNMDWMSQLHAELYVKRWEEGRKNTIPNFSLRKVTL